ncbi:stabilizer of axonemal microtubules 4 [Leptosomus discolor]
MASVRPWVCPRAELWPPLRHSPATGLGPGCPSAKGRAGGSSDLMNFYATTYAVAYGQVRFRPHHGHHTSTGYVTNNHSAVSCLLCPDSAAGGRSQGAATSTTAEDFQPFWLPDGRSLLPRHVHQPASGYLQESSLSCLRPGGVSPQHPWPLQGPPRALREHSAESCRTDPAWPDALQKTIGTKEQSGFTRATPRSGTILPALPDQPLGVSVTTTDYLPPVHSHGGEALPVLPVGSERGSGFSRDVPGCLGTVGLPTVGHPVPLVSQGLRAPRETPASLLGQQRVGRKEPSGFTTNHGQYVPPRPSPAAPAWCWRDPTWMARPVGGIQPQRPSGFSTNNSPTSLGGGHVVGHLPA